LQSTRFLAAVDGLLGDSSTALCKGGYWKRLALSSAVVSTSLLPGMVHFGVDAHAVILTWAWTDMFRLLPHVDVHPAVFGIATELILAAAAARPVASVAATVWFVLNTLGAALFLATFRLEPAG